MSLTRLPTLPVIAMEILQITRDDSLSINQLLPVIEKDPPVAMQVLKVANSAFYGLSEPIESLRHALVIIGMEELSHLVMSFSVIRAFEDGGGDLHKQYEKYREQTTLWKRFWEHSSACAHVSNILSKKLNLDLEHDAYSLGLLHDIGKLVLFKIEPKLYLKSLNISRKRKATAADVEDEIIGVNHQDVGYWIASRWKLPEVIQLGIANHHAPELSPDEESRLPSALVQLADMIAINMGFYFGTELIRQEPHRTAGWEMLKSKTKILDNLEFSELLVAIENDLKQIEDTVQLVEF